MFENSLAAPGPYNMSGILDLPMFSMDDATRNNDSFQDSDTASVASMNQGGLNQGGLNQGGLNQGSMNQNSINQGSMNQVILPGGPPPLLPLPPNQNSLQKQNSNQNLPPMLITNPQQIGQQIGQTAHLMIQNPSIYQNLPTLQNNTTSDLVPGSFAMSVSEDLAATLQPESVQESTNHCFRSISDINQNPFEVSLKAQTSPSTKKFEETLTYSGF